MSTRRRAPKRGALTALVAASALLHAGAAVVAFGLGGGSPRAAAREPEADAPLGEPRCEVTAGLAAAARGGTCAAGPGGPEAGCAGESLRSLELDLIQCRGRRGPEPFLEPGEVEMALVDPEDIPEPEAMEELPEPPPDRRGQVVEITDPESARRPEDARFLSEFDSAVERETVARGTAGEMVERPQEEARERPAGEAGGAGPDSETPGQGEGRERIATRQGAPGGLDGLRAEGSLPTRGEAAPDPSEGGGGGGGSAPDLRPSDELLARAMEGTGGSVDHLAGVEQGERTALNSVQWKHASFFNRIKRQVAQHWEPAQVFRRHDPEGKVFGLRDRITVVRAWLTPEGALSRIIVVRESGVEVLDDEAVRAFRAGQPFPNPPTALVDERSQMISFEFGFHFQIGGNRWRIFRNR